MPRPTLQLVILLLCFASAVSFTVAGNLGVNYGMLANNLPAPAAVAKLLLTTSLRYVKLYSADQATLQVLANTSIKVAVGVTNDEIALLAGNVAAAQAWLQTNVVAYMPVTQFNYIIVGDEVLTVSPELSAFLVPAMSNLHQALLNMQLDAGSLKISTPHNLDLLATSFPPSVGAFNSSVSSAMAAVLAFLSRTNSPFMVNAYPFFAYRANPVNVSLNYALLQQQQSGSNAVVGITDINTGLRYSNLLEAQLDAVYSAMERMGYHDVAVAVSETGWPSGGDSDEIGCGVANAAAYNGNLINLVSSGAGTPLRPGASFDVFIFALFNEDMKPGPSSERNFGLFNVDQTPVYNVGLVQSTTANNGGVGPPPPPPNPNPNPNASSPPPAASASFPPPSLPTPSLSPAAAAAPSTAASPAATTVGPSGPAASAQTQPIGKTWCVAKPGAGVQELSNALNYACGEGGANCVPIQAGNPCYVPNTINSHASFAFNSYYQMNGRNYWNCYFGNTGIITITDPSYNGCPFA